MGSDVKTMDRDAQVRSMRTIIDRMGLEGRNLPSINDLTDGQIYDLFELARALEPWNRSAIGLCPDRIMAALFSSQAPVSA